MVAKEPTTWRATRQKSESIPFPTCVTYHLDRCVDVVLSHLQDAAHDRLLALSAPEARVEQSDLQAATAHESLAVNAASDYDQLRRNPDAFHAANHERRAGQLESTADTTRAMERMIQADGGRR